MHIGFGSLYKLQSSKKHIDNIRANGRLLIQLFAGVKHVVTLRRREKIYVTPETMRIMFAQHKLKSGRNFTP